MLWWKCSQKLLSFSNFLSFFSDGEVFTFNRLICFMLLLTFNINILRRLKFEHFQHRNLYRCARLSFDSSHKERKVLEILAWFAGSKSHIIRVLIKNWVLSSTLYDSSFSISFLESKFKDSGKLVFTLLTSLFFCSSFYWNVLFCFLFVQF